MEWNLVFWMPFSKPSIPNDFPKVECPRISFQSCERQVRMERRFVFLASFSKTSISNDFPNAWCPQLLFQSCERQTQMQQMFVFLAPFSKASTPNAFPKDWRPQILPRCCEPQIQMRRMCLFWVPFSKASVSLNDEFGNIFGICFHASWKSHWRHKKWHTKLKTGGGQDKFWPWANLETRSFAYRTTSVRTWRLRCLLTRFCTKNEP